MKGVSHRETDTLLNYSYVELKKKTYEQRKKASDTKTDSSIQRTNQRFSEGRWVGMGEVDEGDEELAPPC